MSRRPPARRNSTRPADGPNPKAPCPCGSGKRFKVCHGSGDLQPVARPFAGLGSECDWVALRELVPSATAKLTLKDPKTSDIEVTVASVLPMALPALVRRNGHVMIGLQTQIPSTDLSKDAAHALIRALNSGPGVMLPYSQTPANGPRLQDLLVDDLLEIKVHPDFNFWLKAVEDASPEVAASLERANEAVMPTTRLEGLEAAYWCHPGGEKAHLRWVLPYDEEPLLDALARLSAAGELSLGDGTRFAGSFRTLGVVVPVWDLPPDIAPETWIGPAAKLHERLAEALATGGPLNDTERRARAGLRGRQLTLR